MSRTTANRYQIIDALRGSAIGLMIIYHFCFDLNYFGHVQLNFNHDPFWLGFRTLIVSLFLLTMGFSLQLAHAEQINAAKFLRRLGLIAGAAILVSLSSYLMYPKSMIFFGILHFIAVASIFGLAFLNVFYIKLIIGVLILLLSMNLSHPWFNQPALQWLGLMTHKPITEDYVPVVPWMGVVLIGMFLAHWLSRRPQAPKWIRWQSQHSLARTLSFGGQHSLIIYLLHQPVLLGGLYLITQLVK